MNVISLFRRHTARHAADALLSVPVVRDAAGIRPATAGEITEMRGAGPSWPPTIPMAAITGTADAAATVDWPATGLRTTPEPEPASPPCPCGSCPAPPPPAAGPALLSYYPGVTEHMWEIRVANGQWDDIPAEWDGAYVRVHQPARKCRRNIHRNVRAASRRMSVAFDRHPGWAADAELAVDLHNLVADLAEQLDGMQRLSAERWGAAAEVAA